MGKSTRSKVKRHFRAKKREEGVYAATEAARLHRLNMKLKGIASADKEGDVELEDAETDEIVNAVDGETAAQTTPQEDGMEVDSGAAASTKRISTHGPRDSGREQWRKSKGLPARAPSRGINRQGIPAARRKSGRSQRRR